MNTKTGVSKFYIDVTRNNSKTTHKPWDKSSTGAGQDISALDPDKDLEIRLMDTKYVGSGLGNNDKGRAAVPETKRELHNSLTFHALATHGTDSPTLLNARVTIKRVGDVESIDSVDRREPNAYSRPVQLGEDDLPVEGEKGGYAFTGSMSPQDELGADEVTDYPEEYSDYD